MEIEQKDYVLGIDLGSASLGWAMIEHIDGAPAGLIKAGVRIFDAGVDLNKFISGKEGSSNNVARREARQQRTQFRRRAARHRGVFLLLQSAGLLPPNGEPTPNASQARHQVLNELDQSLWNTWKDRILADREVAAGEHVVPYYLRARALDERLEPYELGRALYHLSQRRGFKSNRQSTPKKDEKPGEVKQAISELEAALTEAGTRTLGEYFCKVDPAAQRIRNRWTSRAMFINEFDNIIAAQKPHHAVLTDDFVNKLHHLLFFQRPLQPNDALVGPCELETKEKRAPKASLSAQHLRLLQRVNDMELEEGSESPRRLRAEERELVLTVLTEEGDKTFAQLRKLLGLRTKNTKFTFERGGEKNCFGNRTFHKMYSAFGDEWLEFPEEKREAIVKDWIRAEGEESLEALGVDKWALSTEKAKAWSECKPEPGYSSYSEKAMKRLLPHLEKGIRLNTAIKSEYGEQESAIYDLLPPFAKVTQVRNPAISRAMSELRKVVNAIMRKYGKPQAVRIELARDLKNNAEERERIWKDQRKRQGERETAAKKVLAEVGGEYANRQDIEKYRLAEECGWHCPYTGKQIKMHSLFTAPEFQVEHILPLSRFPDDSFQNKTLCHVGANSTKHNRTPYEAFHGDEESWAKVLARVEAFKNVGKLWKFKLTPEEAAQLQAEFTNRQLQDTRYSSKLAGRYLALLYGGRVEDGALRVCTTTGQVTSTLRAVWQLNRLLGQEGKKNRDDHRHHAVDALVIGLTSQGTIQRMSETAAKNQLRPFKGMEQPWKDFVESLRPHFADMQVSHRPAHRLNGQLHEETNYSPPYQRQGKSVVHIRKKLAAISAGEIEEIVDPAVRRAVQEKLKEFGGDVKKMGASVGTSGDWPVLKTRDGKALPIKKVRVAKSMSPRKIGPAEKERYVQPGNNHHVAIFARIGPGGKEERWEGMPVSRLEAKDRLRRKESVFNRHYSEAGPWEFKFSLMLGDTIQLHGSDGKLDRGGIWILRTIYSEGPLGLMRISDARIGSDVKQAKERWFPSPDALRKLHCRKVEVDLLGTLHVIEETSRRKAAPAG